MPASKDYYQILQVNPLDDQADIEKAFKKLAQQYHPDKVSHLGAEFREIAERKMKDINDAHDVLSDPTRRAEYDQIYFKNNPRTHTEPKRNSQEPRAESKSPPRPEPKTPIGIVCPKCTQLNGLDEIYCQKCLHQLKPNRFCANCGARALDDARFCLNCGRSLA